MRGAWKMGISTKKRRQINDTNNSQQKKKTPRVNNLYADFVFTKVNPNEWRERVWEQEIKVVRESERAREQDTERK